MGITMMKGSLSEYAEGENKNTNQLIELSNFSDGQSLEWSWLWRFSPEISK